MKSSDLVYGFDPYAIIRHTYVEFTQAKHWAVLSHIRRTPNVNYKIQYVSFPFAMFYFILCIIDTQIVTANKCAQIFLLILMLL